MATMTFEGLVDALKVIPPNRAVGIYGFHGCGKTQSWEQIGRKLGYKQFCFVDMGSIADAGDLTGNPITSTRAKKRLKTVNGEFVKVLNKEGLWEGEYESETYESLFTDTAEPYWWPQDETVPAFVIIDEANRIANRSVQNAMMRLVCEGIVGSRRLHPESRIVGSFNPIGLDCYHVQEWDLAYRSRWITFQYEPTVNEWLKIGEDRGFHPEVMRYISNYPAELKPWASEEEMNSIKENDQTKNARAWEKISEMMNNPDWHALYGVDCRKFKPLAAGAIGNKGAEGFIRYLKEKNRIDIKDMLKNFEAKYKAKVEAMVNFDQAMLVRDVIEYLKHVSVEENAAATFKVSEKGLLEFFKTCKEENSTVGYNMLVASITTWGKAIFKAIPKLLTLRSMAYKV